MGGSGLRKVAVPVPVSVGRRNFFPQMFVAPYTIMDHIVAYCVVWEEKTTAEEILTNAKRISC